MVVTQDLDVIGFGCYYYRSTKARHELLRSDLRASFNYIAPENAVLSHTW
jgi:hypothetical protein